MVVTNSRELLPHLENGDRLNRNEFERRYASDPYIKKAELIIVWRTFDRQIDYFVWENGVYKTIEPDENGIIRSREFAGLWLNVTSLLAGDMPTALKTLQAGIATI